MKLTYNGRHEALTVSLESGTVKVAKGQQVEVNENEAKVLLGRGFEKPKPEPKSKEIDKHGN